MVSTRVWAGITGAVLAVSALALGIQQSAASPGEIAKICQNGECVQTIDLSQVTEPQEIRITDERGTNLIEVEPGRIRVLEADCRDQVCVRQGWLDHGPQPIVCLPHRLVIRLEERDPSPSPNSASSPDLDGISR